MSDHDEIDERLSRLTSATSNVKPRADFTARVMQATRARSPGLDTGFWAQLPRAARWVVPAAALLAMVSIGMAATDDGGVDDAIVSADEGDVDW